MPAHATVSAVEHASQVAYFWVVDVADEFGTDDTEFAYAVLRAWLHTLRDRMGVEAAAHFSAQLPDLLRGVFYAGWDPVAVPMKYDAEGYRQRFAREATIAVQDVPKAAEKTTAAVSRHLPGSQLDKALGQLPEDVRRLLRP